VKAHEAAARASSLVGATTRSKGRGSIATPRVVALRRLGIQGLGIQGLGIQGLGIQESRLLSRAAGAARTGVETRSLRRREASRHDPMICLAFESANDIEAVHVLAILED
jgi:hypothetical protein